LFSGCSILVGAGSKPARSTIANSLGSVIFAAICILIILKKHKGLARVAAVIRVAKQGAKMFPQLKKFNNESGIVLFIVLMVAIIIMIISVGILTQSMNETNYAQQQIDQIVSDQLAKGIFWNAYSSAYSSKNMTNMQSVPSTIFNEQNRIYQVSVNYVGFNAADNATIWKSSANYDIFQ
jgi:hypothetical protein